MLNLIDLAGSENCKSSGVDGIALDECKQINSSLSALSGVFKAMAENSNHIPYRDSVLTWLLKVRCLIQKALRKILILVV